MNKPVCKDCQFFDDEPETCNFEPPAEDFKQPEVRLEQVACSCFEKWPPENELINELNRLIENYDGENIKTRE